MKENHIIVPYLDESYMYEYIGEGAIGACYKTLDNQVFKKYHNEIINYDDYLHLARIESKSFVFPKKSVYLDEYGEESFLGYLMDYVDGSKFSEMRATTNIKDLFKKLDLLEKEIKDLTLSEGILLIDLHEDNAFITKDNNIKFIDTDLYEFDTEDVYYDYKFNIRQLANFVIPFFLKDFEFKSERLNRYLYLCRTTGKIKPSFILNEAVNEMEKELKENIITYTDLYRSKRILKK